MPEGDTVFLTALRLHEALAGHRLVRGELRHPKLATHDLRSLRVREVASVGKHVLLRLDDGRTLHSHLRMDGAWHLYRPRARWRGPQHQVRAILATETRIAVGFLLHDLALVATSEEQRLVGHLGPDLLDPGWDRAAHDDAAGRLAADPHRELGAALLDQTVMAGVGNLYQNEVCFLLGVTPWVTVSAIDAHEAVRLSRELLVRNAYRPEQSTTGSLARGEQQWVYQRTGRGCLRCGTSIQSAVQATTERRAYTCARCQRGPHQDAPGQPRRHPGRARGD